MGCSSPRLLLLLLIIILLIKFFIPGAWLLTYIPIKINFCHIKAHSLRKKLLVRNRNWHLQALSTDMLSCQQKLRLIVEIDRSTKHAATRMIKLIVKLFPAVLSSRKFHLLLLNFTQWTESWYFVVLSPFTLPTGYVQWLYIDDLYSFSWMCLFWSLLDFLFSVLFCQ